MNFTITRSLLVTMVPGIILVSPWILLLLITYPDISVFYKTYPILTQVVLVSLVVVLATLSEGAATSLEVHWNEIREDEFNVKSEWYDYLSTTLEVEPVGYRYISTRVDFMYFELNLMVASVSFFLGCSYLLCRTLGTDYFFIQILLICMAIFSWRYLRSEAKKTHKVLCRVRKEVNAKLDEDPNNLRKQDASEA